MSTHSEQWLDGTGGRIFTRHWEHSETPKANLVICHGVNSHGGQYIRAGEEFAARGFAVTALDLRGRGRSDGERFYAQSIDDYVSDLSQAIELGRSKHPDLPVYLLGHSAGEPPPTVSIPCKAQAVSDRAQALSCEALSENEDRSDADRRWYSANCVDDDYVVESENDHGVVISYAGSTFYLGKDCDVRSAKFGRGRWEWANGGWSMIFGHGRELGFARRDAPMDEEACRS